MPRKNRYFRKNLVQKNQGIRLEMKYRHVMTVIVVLGLFASCSIYSPYGAQTSGASTFSVSDFEPAHPLVSTTAAQSLAEALRDRIQRQSTLRLVEDGELKFSARVVGWEVRPVNVLEMKPPGRTE